MKSFYGLLALCLAFAAVAAQAATIVEVPGPTAVQAAVKGASARDRLARQSATAFVLSNLVRVQVGKDPATAAQTARIAELEKLRTQVENENETNLPAACRGQDCDERYAFNRCVSAYQFSPAFYRAVYDRFFDATAQKSLTPRLSSGAGTVWQEAAAMAAGSQPLDKLAAPSRECGGGGASASTGATTTAQATATQSHVVAAQPNAYDESLRKARAAGVDTTVFGLKLGEAVRLPVCPDRGLMAEMLNPDVDQTCVMSLAGVLEMTDDLTVILGGEKTVNPYDLTIAMSKEACPDWVWGCQFYGQRVDGRLVAVFVLTTGLAAQDQVAAALTKKYKAWSSKGWYQFVNDTNGDKVDALDMTWALAGLNVHFKGFTGGTRAATGSVLIETEAAARQRAQTEKARQDKKQQL